MVLSFLHLGDLFNASLVNKTWYRLVKDAAIWHTRCRVLMHTRLDLMFSPIAAYALAHAQTANGHQIVDDSSCVSGSTTIGSVATDTCIVLRWAGNMVVHRPTSLPHHYEHTPTIFTTLSYASHQTITNLRSASHMTTLVISTLETSSLPLPRIHRSRSGMSVTKPLACTVSAHRITH
jgi:hypothetical protein